MCLPFFVGSVHDFGKSDDDIILGEKCFFPIHESVVSCPTCTKNLGWFLVLLLVQPKCQGEMSFIQVDLYAQDRLCLEPLQYESENLQ